MKKLMVIAAAAMMAFASQAAGYKWAAAASGAVIYAGTTSTLYDKNSDAMLYLFVAAEGSGATLRGSVFDDLKGGTALSGYYTSTGIDSTSKTVALSWEDSKQAGKKFDMFFATVIKDADGNDQFFISSLKTSQAYASGSTPKSVAWSDLGTATQSVKDAADGLQSKSYWYSAAPEPTSGLLMLLGFAGLALRRRRA